MEFAGGAADLYVRLGSKPTDAPTTTGPGSMARTTYQSAAVAKPTARVSAGRRPASRPSRKLRLADDDDPPRAKVGRSRKPEKEKKALSSPLELSARAPSVTRGVPSMTMATPRWSVGSRWHRWDPHIHTPVTVLANMFAGDWTGFVERVNQAEPPARALGVTDYGCIRGYKALRSRWEAGELPMVKLIFPNVELRLTVQTKRGSGINIHLLFSPEDRDHESRIESFLGRLTFHDGEESFGLSTPDLIRLGKKFKPTLGGTEDKAFEEGINQFKVDFDLLRLWYKSDKWLEENCLIAVAAGMGDGTSGLQDDSGFAIRRIAIEKFAHIIFSGRPNDRLFWVGERRDLDRDEVDKRGGLKPCLHGSDAHSLEKVLTPDEGRRCWIKGDLTFESLRQAIHEPAERSFVGEQAPAGPAGFDVISSITVDGMPWITNTTFDLNAGLVTIIGPKGSGKTALADLLAFGADAFDDQNDRSFLMKAREHLRGASVTIIWGDGTKETRPLHSFGDDGQREPPRVRYLSQQFVEHLCGTEGLGQPLLDEVEAVVYRALDEDDRMETTDFGELREVRVSALHRSLEQYQTTIRRTSEQLDQERALEVSLPAKRKQLDELARQGEAAEKELKALLVKGKEDRIKNLANLEARCRTSEQRVATLKARQQKLRELRTDVEQARRSWSEQLLEWQRLYESLPLKPDEWNAFTPRFSGDVARIIDTTAVATDRLIELEMNGNADKSLLTDPPREPLSVLRTTTEQLRKELGIDAQRERKYAEVQARAQRAERDRGRLKKELEHIEKAPERVMDARTRRREAYAGIFETLAQEERVLRELYDPLEMRIGAQASVVSKLSFHVHRRVDLATWTQRGEALLDLRKKSPIHGQGTLASIAKRTVLEAWRKGTAQEVADAMDEFIQSAGLGRVQDFLAHDVSLGSFVDWLFSTDHVRVEYGIRYDGVDLRHLSPGTRGIVLLILYLAIDEWDSRPIIADQPEENLDPQSIFDDLVGYFRQACRRRQVIIVTHNANLVVNTDADQVIVASSQRVADQALPRFTYEAGPLEDRAIRGKVCRILEGGRRAFLKRARRYSLHRTSTPVTSDD